MNTNILTDIANTNTRTHCLVIVVDVGQEETIVHAEAGRGQVQLHVRVVRVTSLCHLHKSGGVVTQRRRPRT